MHLIHIQLLLISPPKEFNERRYAWKEGHSLPR